MLLEDWPLSSPSTPPLVSMVWADGLLASRYARFYNCHRFPFFRTDATLEPSEITHDSVLDTPSMDTRLPLEGMESSIYLPKIV